MTADRLRAAASLMRERAEAATPGPWYLECSHGDPSAQIHLVLDVMRDKYGNNSVSTDDHKTAEHIASWHPAVALAVADWLWGVAAYHDDPGEQPEQWYAHALAVANAYLGESS